MRVDFGDARSGLGSHVDGGSRRNVGWAVSQNLTIVLTITPCGSRSVQRGPSEDSNRESPAKRGLSVAAGPGFEPGLSDSELLPLCSSLFAHVPKTAYLSQIFRSLVSRYPLVFVPVTVSVPVKSSRLLNLYTYSHSLYLAPKARFR